MFIAFLFSDPNVRVPEGCEANSKHYGVQSRPTTAKICDITYYIATNSLRHQRRRSHRTQGDITKEWLFSTILAAQFLIGIGNRNELIMYLSHDQQHVAARQRISSIPTHSIHPLRRVLVATYLTSIQLPPTTRHLVASALPRQFIRGALRPQAAKSRNYYKYRYGTVAKHSCRVAELA